MWLVQHPKVIAIVAIVLGTIAGFAGIMLAYIITAE